MAATGYPHEWYTRRGGVVRGPFTPEQVSRHLILGRICLDDELSTDAQNWQPADRCTGLLPPELQQLETWEDYQRLLIARMQVDERKGERRCQTCNNPAQCQPERRVNGERRSGDTDRLVSHYLFGHSHASKRQLTQTGNTRPLLLTLLLVTMLFAWLIPTQR